MEKIRTKITFILLFLLMGLSIVVFIFSKNYSHRFCSKIGYSCIRVRKGDTWKSLWPNAKQRDIVMRLNRRNLKLYPGLVIAVPNDLLHLDNVDIAPLPYNIKPLKSNAIIISLKTQSFGAYDQDGYLVHWGPASGGKGWCPDINRSCETVTGTFFIHSKKDINCISKTFPVPKGGASMPYCMFFYEGYAIHAGDLPGKHISHGCVRLFFEDAKWLNTSFIKVGHKGTIVVVK